MDYLRMNPKLLTILFFLCTSNLYSQNTESAIKAVSASVAYLNENKIQTIVIDGKPFEIWLREKGSTQLVPKIERITGSAFFVNDSIHLSAYLVTAEHVAKEMTLNSDIIINGPSDKPIAFKLKDISFRKDSLAWTYNKAADVAVLLLDNNSSNFKNSYIGLIPIEFLEPDRIPVRERDVTIIGFPLELGFNNYFSPISKISKPVSGLTELPRGDNNKIATFYLLGDPSIGGFSGSPVFELPTQFMLGDRPLTVHGIYLIGLVHGSIGDKNTGGGFAAIVPSKYILETISNSPKFFGPLKIFHANGKLWTERIYKDGKPWKVLNNYDKNGQKTEAGTLDNGNGTLYVYNEDARLIFIQYYQNGILLKTDRT